MPRRLTNKQMKIAKVAQPRNRITKADFTKLKKTKKPRKKIQYIQVTAVFLLLLNATNSGSSILDISCFPLTG